SELLAAVAGRKRRIDDSVVLAALVRGPGARVKRHLVGGAIHHRLVGPEDVLRAIAVMDVKVDDRDALGAVATLRMAGRDRCIVEQAEPHRPRGLGMVSGRPYRNESIANPPA